MEDYNRVLEATSVAENANGVAAEKMTVYNESLEAAQNRLTASVQQFAQDSNLDRTLALAYDGLSKVVEILNILLNKIPVLSPLIKALGVALAAAFGAKMISSIGAITSAIGSIGAAASSVGTILTTTAVTIGSFAVPVWGVVAAVTAIAGAIGLVVQAAKDNTPEAKLEKLNQELEDGQGNLKDTQGQISEIDKKIKEIDDKGTLTLADEQEKTRLEEQRDVLEQILQYQKDINEEKLKEIKEEVSAQMGEKYTSGTIDSDTAYESKKRTRSGVGSSYAAASGSTTEYYNAENASVSELLANIRLLNEEQQELANTEGNHSQELSENNKLIQENINQLKQRATSIGEDISKMQELGLTNTQTYKDAVSQWNQLQSYLDPSNFEKISLESLIDTSGLKQKIQKAAQDASDTGKEAAKGYAEKFAQQILNDNSMKQAWATSMGVTAEYLESNTDVLIQEILSKFQQMYVDIGESAQKGYSSASQAFSDYLNEVDALSEKQTTLNKALGEMEYNGELTSDTVRELTKEYPQLSDKIEIHNGKLVIEKQYLEDVWTTAVEASREKQQAQINDTKTTIENIQSRIKAYMGEIEVLQQMAAAGDKSAGRVAELRGILDDPNVDKNSAKYINAAREFGTYMTKQNTELYKYSNALQKAEEIYNNLGDIPGLTATKPKGYKSGSSGTSAADKAAKEFEDSIKDKVKNLKSIVDLYSEQQNWEDSSVIQKFTTDYNNLLTEVINNPKARKVLADAFNLDISKMSEEDQIKNLTTLWQKQAGTIQETYQKLLKSLAKEDLNSAKAIIEKYKEGIYGAWSSDEALNAAKADYQKFIDKITNDADYRAAMAEALNLGDISGESVEKQVEAVISALLKSTGTLDDAQQDLYDDASKNIKALQDEIEDMIDTAIGLLEKAGDFLFDMLGKISDRYDAQIDNLDKISDELDDQKDAFEDKIDQQKELLKLQKEEMDNADELAEKNKSIADIDAQLMELQYDDSAEAQAKRLKLLDERAQKEKDLSDWQKDNDYDVKIDALDKEKSEYEKTIEAEKKAIEAQKQALQDAQKQFETTLGNIQNGFNTFIKILSSDLVKNLISKALINTGSDTVTNLLTGYNKLFGTGIDSDVTGTIKKAYKSLKDIGKATETSFVNTGKTFNEVINNMASSGGGIIQKFANGAKGITSTVLNGINTVFNNGVGFIQRLTQYGINSLGSLGNIGSGIISNLGGVASQVVSTVIQGGSKLLSGIGGIVTSLGKGIGSLLGIGGTTGATGAAAAGGAAATAGGAGLLSTLGTAGVVLVGGANAIGSVGAYWKDTIGLWKNKDKNFGQKLGGTLLNAAKTMIPGYGLYRIGKAIFGKHHSGSDYVKKQNPMLDKMLGLGNDETVSILKVGEAVVPTWANNATPSSSNNRFTGSPFGSAVDTAVKSARTNTRTYSSSDNSSINISMPINIQGDADASTVNSLKKEADNIVNKVLRTINNQTRLGGYKNIKAATI